MAPGENEFDTPAIHGLAYIDVHPMNILWNVHPQEHPESLPSI